MKILHEKCGIGKMCFIHKKILNQSEIFDNSDVVNLDFTEVIFGVKIVHRKNAFI